MTVAEDTASARQDALTASLVCYYSRQIGDVARQHCEGVAVVTYGNIVLCSMCDKMRSAVGRTNIARKLPGVELFGLIEAARALRLSEQRLERAARLARDAGASWSQLGDAVGVSRQAAQQRFGAVPPAPLTREESEST